LFDPQTNTFTASKSPLADQDHIYVVPQMLPDGRVFIVSDSGEVQIYDPDADNFTLTGFKAGLTLSRLRDGRIFTGSSIYDSDTNSNSPTGGGFPPAPNV